MALISANLQKLYVAYIGRPADCHGLAFWLKQQSASLDEIAAAFATLPAILQRLVKDNPARALIIDEVFRLHA